MVFNEFRGKVCKMEWLETDNTDIVLTTGQLTRMFGVPMGMHPVITGIRAIETSLTSQQDLFAFIDGKDPDQTRVLGGGQTHFNIATGAGSNFSRKALWVRVEADTSNFIGSHYPSEGPFNVWNDIRMAKAQTATWGFDFEYYLARGAMMWLDEWAALLRDKSNVAQHGRSPGQPYYQAGDYFQMGRRPFSIA